MGINNADNILDLVAVGMIADMMDLKDFINAQMEFLITSIALLDSCRLMKN